MASIASPSEDPLLQRVIEIPLILDLICLYLEPRHILAALAVSRAFHNLFLPYRWKTLTSIKTLDAKPHKTFPRTPSPEIETALVQYGIDFARHVVLPPYENRLVKALIQLAVESKTTTYVDNHRPRLRLKSLKQVDQNRSSVGSLWMHWDDEIHWDDLDHSRVVDENIIAEQLALQDALISLTYCCHRVLTLASHSLATLQRLHIDDFPSSFFSMDVNKDMVTSLSVQLIQVLFGAKSLQALTLGALSMENIVNVFLHLPGRVQELTLKFWTKKHWGDYYEDYYAGAITPVDFEESWARYHKALRAQEQYAGHDDNVNTQSPSNTAINGRADHDSEDKNDDTVESRPIVQTLMQNTSIKSQLRRLSLSEVCTSHPPWILFEILRHCPNVTSFRPPYVYGRDLEAFARFLREEWSGKIEHLDLSEFGITDEEGVTFLRLLVSPQGQQDPFLRVESSRFAETSGNNNKNNNSMSSKNNSARGGGLRSFTLLGDDQFGTKCKTELEKHFATLERISVRQCARCLTGRDILTWLTRCSRLDTLLMMHGLLSVETNIPFINWIDFVESGRIYTVNPFDDYYKDTDDYNRDTEDYNSKNSDSDSNTIINDELSNHVAASLILDKVSLPTAALMPNTAYPSSSSLTGQEETGTQSLQHCSPTNVVASDTEPPRSILSSRHRDHPPNCYWSCTKTLRVLSLSLVINEYEFRTKQPRFQIRLIYERLGELEALEDLALRCNYVLVYFNPWRGHPTIEEEEDAVNLSIPSQDMHRMEHNKAVKISLDCSLVQGLAEMSKLKRLRRLNVLKLPRPRIGPAEVEWMDQHWPKFESLIGLHGEEQEASLDWTQIRDEVLARRGKGPGAPNFKFK
ncbi:hypothetical protein BGZ83_011341 [Gryganskiella cystojenkinii]|nr:hypothetical protein BGZ83_011341 [Gryganskiella cystojenkinii]